MSLLISENINFKNIIICTLKDEQGNVLLTQKQKNTIPNVGKQLILDNLGGMNQQIKHGAMGSTSGATSAGSVLLGSEFIRQPCIYTRAGQTGTFSMFFTTAQANTNITEIGFFGGTSSFTSTNTGVMFNRILLDPTLQKDNTKTLTVDLDIGF